MLENVNPLPEVPRRVRSVNEYQHAPSRVKTLDVPRANAIRKTIRFLSGSGRTAIGRYRTTIGSYTTIGRYRTTIGRYRTAIERRLGDYRTAIGRLPDSDRIAIGYDRWRSGLVRPFVRALADICRAASVSPLSYAFHRVVVCSAKIYISYYRQLAHIVDRVNRTSCVPLHSVSFVWFDSRFAGSCTRICVDPSVCLASMTNGPSVGTTPRTTGSDAGPPAHRFSRVWQSLCRCYEHNGRSIERAYGYFTEVNALYNSVVGGNIVQRIVFTNVPVERAEHRDMLIAAATGKSIFYAVLTLVPNEATNATSLGGTWWQDSLFFAELENDELFAQLFDAVTTDVDYSAPAVAEEDETTHVEIESVEEEEPCVEAEDVVNTPQTEEEDRHIVARDARMGPTLSIENHPLFTEDVQTATGHYCDNSDSDDEDEMLRGHSGESNNETMGRIPSYRSLLMVVSDFPAAFQLDNLGLEIGLRESHLHDNFRKKSSVFFRSMNSSSSSWTRELYRQFFSSFYQDTKRLPRSDVFRGPLVEYI